MLHCLTREQMLACLAEDLPEAELAAATDHLETCSACQALAAELTDDESLRLEYRVCLVPAGAAMSGATDGPTDRFSAAALLSPDTPTANCDDTAQADPSLTAVASRVIGPYRLVERIGVGGFGEVYRAEQQHPIRRSVALKVIKPGMDSREIIARFEAERQALALMDHPNIARIIDAGTTGTDEGRGSRVEGGKTLGPRLSTLDPSPGRPYFVMELVPGRPITDFCDEHRFSIKKRLELFITVCQAVQHAHQKGIIHRDLKPSNVLVTERDGEPVVKVIDFGIAKALGASMGDGTAVTGAAQLVGTPLYMSPEQVGFGTVDVDTRSDVYSLGVLLYELLTGTTPFEKSRLQQSDIAQWQRIVREEEPPRPSARLSALGRSGLPSRTVGKIDAPTPTGPTRQAGPTDATSIAECRETTPRELSRHVRGDLDWIVLKSLEKVREQRYESVSALAHDLERLLAHEPVEARAPSRTYRLRKFIRRNRTVTVLAGLLVVALLAGTVVSAAFGIQARTALADMKEAQLGYKNEHDRAQQNLVNAAETVQRLLTRVAQEKLFTTPGGTHLRRELLIEAAQQMEALSEGQRDPQLLIRIAGAYRDIGTIHHHCGDFSSAAEALNRSLELLSSLPDSGEHLDSAVTEQAHLHAVLGEVYWYQGRQEDALAELNLAITSEETLCETHLSASPYLGLLEGAVSLRGLVKSTMASGDLGRGDFERALTLAHEILVDDSDCDLYEMEQKRLRIVNNQLYLAILRSRSSEEETALAMFDEVLALIESIDATLGTAVRAPDHSEVALNPLPAQLQVRFRKSEGLIGKGRCLLSMDDRDGAHECVAEAVQVLEPIARDFPDIFWTRTQLANAYASLAETGGYEAAIIGLRRLVELNPNDSRLRFSLAFTLEDGGEFDAAIDELRRAIDLDPHDAKAHSNLGDALFRSGKVDAAIEEFRRAIELKPHYAEAQSNLGVALAEKGDLNAAIDEHRLAIELNPHYAEAHFKFGVALAKKGDWNAAIDEYRRAIELKPHYAVAHSNLGIALFRKGEVAAAIGEYRRVTELRPDDVETRCRIAQALMKNGDTEGAIAECRHAIQSKPDFADAHYWLGVALGSMGDMGAAVAEYCAAATLFRDKLAKEPLLGEDVNKWYRYNAACAASLASASTDAPNQLLTDDDRLGWRTHAHDWLTADLATWQKIADSTPDARPRIAKTLAHWQTDLDLASIRDAEPLAQLPDAERQQWQTLWSQVEQLRASLAPVADSQ